MSMFSRRAAARALVIAVPLALTAMPSALFAQSSTEAIRVTDAWLRETAPGQTAGGGFLTITNNGKADDRLTGGGSARAAQVQVHDMRMEGGVMRMRPLDGGLPLPAGRTATLKPGGLHLMLIGLKQPLKRGERVPVTLTFARAGKVTVDFIVQPITHGTGGRHDHH